METNNYSVSISRESKLKEKNVITVMFKVTSDVNCRIRILSGTVYDSDGYIYKAKSSDISLTDILIGQSRFFADSASVDVSFSHAFKSRIGCSLVLTIVEQDNKRKINLCFQKKGSTRWDLVGTQELEYDENDLKELAKEEHAREEVMAQIESEFADLDDDKYTDSFEENDTDTEFTGNVSLKVKENDDVTRAKQLEEHLNSIIDYDEASARKVGFSLRNIALKVSENDDRFAISIDSEAYYTDVTYVAAHCPIIKVMFHDKTDSIVNLGMKKVSRLKYNYQPLEMCWKGASYDYWHDMSKIKIMITL